MKPAAPSFIYTNKARCRDCYRCVRVCPVKAIRLRDGQAAVVAERCIGCGTCVRECPQGAKTIRNDVDAAVALLGRKKKVGASIAPSFAAAFSEWQIRRLPSALRRLGFSYVAETAIGAEPVAKETRRIAEERPGQSLICSACPAVVRFVELHHPGITGKLSPVVSPMIAHARHMHTVLGDECGVVFVGPCAAKKGEAERPEYAGIVDVVITFRELILWLEQAGIDLAECEESGFDEYPAGGSRYFPLEGGLLRTAGIPTDMLDEKTEAVSGYWRVHEALAGLAEKNDRGVLIEPLFCPQGCIGGPGMPVGASRFQGRHEVIGFAQRGEQSGRLAEPRVDIGAVFRASDTMPDPAVTEAAIRRVLSLTGKTKEEDQLNCGACGYASCREKAIAVIQGLAEPEMCIPYMRRMAEQRTDRIIETSPNGIIIVDEHLQVLHVNSAFKRMFACSASVCGKAVGHLFDPAPFERLAANEVSVLRDTKEHAKYGITCHEILYKLVDENQIVGIYVNVTETQERKRELDALRAQTISQARELLENQLQLATTIARALGENTARAEALIERLTALAGGESENDE